MAQDKGPIFGWIVLIIIIIGGILWLYCCIKGHCCGRNIPKPSLPTIPRDPRVYTIINPTGPTPTPPVTCSTEFTGYDTNGNLNSACGQAPCNPRRPGYDIYGKVNRNCGTALPPPPPPPYNQA